MNSSTKNKRPKPLLIISDDEEDNLQSSQGFFGFNFEDEDEDEDRLDAELAEAVPPSPVVSPSPPAADDDGVDAEIMKTPKNLSLIHI